MMKNDLVGAWLCCLKHTKYSWISDLISKLKDVTVTLTKPPARHIFKTYKNQWLNKPKTQDERKTILTYHHFIHQKMNNHTVCFFIQQISQQYKILYKQQYEQHMNNNMNNNWCFNMFQPTNFQGKHCAPSHAPSAPSSGPRPPPRPSCGAGKRPSDARGAPGVAGPPGAPRIEAELITWRFYWYFIFNQLMSWNKNWKHFWIFNNLKIENWGCWLLWFPNFLSIWIHSFNLESFQFSFLTSFWGHGPTKWAKLPLNTPLQLGVQGGVLQIFRFGCRQGVPNRAPSHTLLQTFSVLPRGSQGGTMFIYAMLVSWTAKTF